MGPIRRRGILPQSPRLALVPCLLLGIAALGLVAADPEFFEGILTTYGADEEALSGGNCALMAAPPGALKDFVAINNEQFEKTINCGRCVEITCTDSRCNAAAGKQVGYVVNKCPECKRGDLDLSPGLLQRLTGKRDDRWKSKWRFVDCPVSGNIEYCLKPGSSKHWTAIQPTMMRQGVKELKINGQTPTMVDSAYFFLVNGGTEKPVELDKVKLTVTSVMGETVEDTVALTPGNCTAGQHQFAAATGDAPAQPPPPAGGGSNSAPPPPTGAVSKDATPPTPPAAPTPTTSSAAPPPGSQGPATSPSAPPAAPPATPGRSCRRRSRRGRRRLEGSS